MKPDFLKPKDKNAKPSPALVPNSKKNPTPPQEDGPFTLLTKRVEVLEASLDTITKDQNALKAVVNSLSNSQDLPALAARVDALEKKQPEVKP